MAKKRRRRQQYKTRPPKPRSPETDDPSLQQFDDATAPVETAPYAPVAPSAAASIGMPVAAALGQQPDVEEQGYARGGAIALPGGFGNFPSVQSDPVARRRYSPRHVGYAEGGEVDPMGFVPDQPMPSAQPQQPQFDPYSMVGRQEPIISPFAAVRPETGYAKGGPVAAAQVPAYTDPVYPAPSAANAKLYADMDAARERVVRPSPLPSRTAPPPVWQMPTALQGDPRTQIHTGIRYGQGPTLGTETSNSYAQGGAVPEEGGTAPDAEGYLNGNNAMDPQELEGILQQIAQLDPNQSEDAVNLTAIVQAAQSGDMDRASSILAGFRRRFDRLNATAQGAAAHGDMAAAAQLAGKAHSQVPDGMTVAYTVSPEGSVTATVSPSNASFTMDWQQFHDYLVGPATSFDHILENGLEKNLAIASGGQKGGQQAPGDNPAPTGYAEGGEVEKKGHPESEIREASEDDSWGRIKQQPFSMGRTGPGPTSLSPDSMRPRDTEPERRVFQPRGYAEGGEVEDDDDDDESYGAYLTKFPDEQRTPAAPRQRAPAKTKKAEAQPASDPYDVAPAERYELPFTGVQSITDTNRGTHWENPEFTRSEAGERRQYAEELSSQRRLKDIDLGRTPEQRELRNAERKLHDAEEAVKRHNTGYGERGASQQDDGSRQSVKDVLDHTRRQYGLANDDPENAAPYQVAGDWMPPPAGGRTALDKGIGLPDEPAGGKTSGGDFLQRLKSGLGFGDGEGTASASSRRGAPVAEPAAAAEPRMGARPVPGPASARGGVEYPDKLPAEDTVRDIISGPGGPTSSARRGVGTRPVAAAPEPQQLGSREDISLPPAAQPAAGRQPLPPNASAAEVNAAAKAAHAAAAERGDIYTTPRWSWDRLTKEGIPDIMQGKVFGRKNTVDYPADVLARRDELVQQNRETERRQQPQTSGVQPSRQQVEPHEQRMRDIDQQQQQLRQPIAPAGSNASQPKSYEGRGGVDRYNKEVMADQHRYTNEVHQRNEQIAEQRHQDDLIRRTYENAKKEGADTSELKAEYDAAMYRLSGGKLRIPRAEQPVTKKEEPGIMQRIFGGNTQTKPATMGGYGSPGTPPRPAPAGQKWYYSPSTGQFELRPG